MSQGGPVKGIGAIDPRMSANGRRFMISASALATLVMCLCLTGSIFALAASAEVARDEKPDDRAPHSSKDRVSVASNSRIPGSYIVVLNESVAHPGATARQQVAQRDGDLGFVYQELNGYSVSDLSKGDAGALRADPRVNYVAPDHKVKVLSQTTPTGISRIFANENPFMDIDGVDDVRINADVAVIDVGVDASHPDLNVVERTDCSAGPPCVNGSGGYGGGHGTHVAGIVGAIDNGVGVVGVAPGARIWAVKVLDEEGYGSASNDIAGIEWVTAHASQIEVANMSIGFEGRSVPEEEAIEKSIEAGVVYAVAASNDSYNAEGVYPANDPDVLTVSNLVDYDGKPGGLGSSTCRDRG